MFLNHGKVYVVSNQCLHAGSPLDGGAVSGHRVQCPWHGWTYDLATGRHLTAFGERPGIETYRSWIEDGVVKVDLPDSVGD